VRLDLEMSFELQCGRPGGGPAFVSLPTASSVPERIPLAAVLVDGHPPASITVSGRVVRLGLPRPTGIICDVIGPGVVTVVFTRAAGLGNPRLPGRYLVTMRLGLQTAVATFAVS
jgi:hypothetical protein